LKNGKSTHRQAISIFDLKAGVEAGAYGNKAGEFGPLR
jgi:hypothetical protein